MNLTQFALLSQMMTTRGLAQLCSTLISELCVLVSVLFSSFVVRSAFSTARSLCSPLPVICSDASKRTYLLLAKVFRCTCVASVLRTDLGSITLGLNILMLHATSRISLETTTTCQWTLAEATVSMSIQATARQADKLMIALPCTKNHNLNRRSVLTSPQRFALLEEPQLSFHAVLSSAV